MLQDLEDREVDAVSCRGVCGAFACSCAPKHTSAEHPRAPSSVYGRGV